LKLSKLSHFLASLLLIFKSLLKLLMALLKRCELLIEVLPHICEFSTQTADTLQKIKKTKTYLSKLPYQLNLE
jgi:hypothetical protein